LHKGFDCIGDGDAEEEVVEEEKEEVSARECHRR